MLICAGITALQIASATTWDSPTHDCSLAFPEEWTFKQGPDIGKGQALLIALNREQNKSLNVLRFQMAPSTSVQNPQFAKGMKDGFTEGHARVLNDGYTNLNGRVAYWFSGEKRAKGVNIFTLSYSLCNNGTLYQLNADSLGPSPLDDNEVTTILASFRIHGPNLAPTKTIPDVYAASRQIGRITAFLLIIILVAGIIVKATRKRTKGRNGAPNN